MNAGDLSVVAMVIDCCRHWVCTRVVLGIVLNRGANEQSIEWGVCGDWIADMSFSAARMRDRSPVQVDFVQVLPLTRLRKCFAVR